MNNWFKRKGKDLEIKNEYTVNGVVWQEKRYKLPKEFVFELGTTDDEVWHEIFGYMVETFLEEEEENECI